MMRILIVEDDRELAAALDDALRYEGYATSLATTGVEALKILAGTNVDIMLLDRDLPVLSGDAVMATVAANRIPVAVIMLTAAAEVSDRVSGLDLGADDYLTKPFVYPELLARIRALQRRSGATRPQPCSRAATSPSIPHAGSCSATTGARSSNSHPRSTAYCWSSCVRKADT